MRIGVGDLTLEVEVSGPEDGEPLLLIAGFGQQLTGWNPEMVEGLASAGHRVIAYDHRDIGLSDSIALDVEPDVIAILGGDHATVPYTLGDLAADAVGVLDALDIGTAHVVGHSMGGAVAQRLVTAAEDRVDTLTLFGASPGDGSGPMDPEVLTVLAAPVGDDRDASVDKVAEMTRLAADPYPVAAEVARERADRLVDRWVGPLAGGRQMAAVLADGDRTPVLGDLRTPTLVVHGSGDRFIGVTGGRTLAEIIPGARLVEIEGMGHAVYAPEHLGELLQGILAHTGAAA